LPFFLKHDANDIKNIQFSTDPLVGVHGDKTRVKYAQCKTRNAGNVRQMEFCKNAVIVNGVVTLLASVLILFPKTFVLGNFLMAAGILLIICLQLLNKDLKSVAIEIPFLLLNLVIIYLQHP